MIIKEEQIREEVKKRGINYLIHFTRIGNLASILRNGIVTRDEITSDHIVETCNDLLRLDRTNGICLSISFPNYKMLYYYRKKFPHISWVILGLSPDILWKKNCSFHYTNAASRSAQNVENHRKFGILGFNSLFSELAGKRQYLNIPDYYTTDPQAEIIVTEKIEKEFIEAYAVRTLRDSQMLSAEFPGKKFEVIDKFFSYRKDYSYWQNHKE